MTSLDIIESMRMILIIYLHSNSILNTKYPVINLAKGKKSGDKSELILVKDYRGALERNDNSRKDLSERPMAQPPNEQSDLASSRKDLSEVNLQNTIPKATIEASILELEQRILNIENYLAKGSWE